MTQTVQAAAGYCVLRYKFNRAAKAVDVRSIAATPNLRQPVVAWRVNDAGRAEPVTPFADIVPYGSDEMVALLCPGGAILSLQTNEIWPNEPAWLSACYEAFTKWKAAVAPAAPAPAPRPIAVLPQHTTLGGFAEAPAPLVG